jgi:hypothetical protein
MKRIEIADLAFLLKKIAEENRLGLDALEAIIEAQKKAGERVEIYRETVKGKEKEEVETYLDGQDETPITLSRDLFADVKLTGPEFVLLKKTWDQPKE